MAVQNVMDLDADLVLVHRAALRGRPPALPLRADARAFAGLVLTLLARPPRRPSATAAGFFFAMPARVAQTYTACQPIPAKKTYRPLDKRCRLCDSRQVSQRRRPVLPTPTGA